ncbi:YidH family protein [Alienimonas sp. DA493]|uniref:YidH family protein n=1 Tax=Alienimonas sp. DA493 TaxID=3373605 RepID=UPI003754B7E2
MAEPKDPRVLFAAERTLLAWNRTSVALIAFGFLIERSGLLIKFAAADEADVDEQLLFVTAWIGLLFILVGAAVAVYSSRQYANVLKTLPPTEFPDGYAARWGMAVNVAVAALGLALAATLMWMPGL